MAVLAPFEGDPPWTIDFDGPSANLPAPERMQAKAWQI